MEFTSIENKHMIWNILSELCQKEHNAPLSNIANFPIQFEAMVNMISKGITADLMTMNKQLVSKCHEIILQQKRENPMDRRFQEARTEMNSMLQGYRPPEIDFSDPKEQVSRLTGAPPIKIEEEVSSVKIENIPVVKSHINFERDEYYKMSADLIEKNSFSFFNLNIPGIKIVTLFMHNNNVTKIGENPFIFCKIFVNDMKEKENVLFLNKGVIGKWVHFESYNPIYIRKQLISMNIEIVNMEKEIITIGKQITILNENEFEIGDEIQIDNQRKKISGDDITNGTISPDENHLIYYGKSPILIFTI